jgi:hypothetical protein
MPASRPAAGAGGPFEAAAVVAADDVAQPAGAAVGNLIEYPAQVAGRFDTADHLGAQRHVLDYDIGVHQLGSGRRVIGAERLLQGGCRGDVRGCGPGGDLGVLEVGREGAGRARNWV